MQNTTIFLSAVAIFTLTACTTISERPISSAVYSTSNAYRAQYVNYGTVISTREVLLQNDDNITGVATGAVVGGLLGNQIGKGNGRVVGTIAGVAAGATLGKVIDRNMSQQTAQEIIVRRSNGEDIAVIQGFDQKFKPGDRVAILNDGNSIRIRHY